MKATDQLLAVARAYAEAEGIGLVTVSSRVFKDSKKLNAIEAGGSIYVDRFEFALRWFSENWPETAVWPDGVTRPAPSEAVA